MRNPAWPNSAGRYYKGERIPGTRGKEKEKNGHFEVLYYQLGTRALNGLTDFELDRLRERFAGSVGDGESVSGCFLWRKIETTSVRRPNGASGRIEGDGFGVGNVVAKLGGLAAMNDSGRNVESTDGEFVAAEFFDSGAIVGALLLGLLLGDAVLVRAIRFVAGGKEDSDVRKNGDENNCGIEITTLEDGFLGRRLRIHTAALQVAPGKE